MGMTKKNVKVKRRIRKTVGSLLMVSAITVAAIPVPGNVAYDPQTDNVPIYSYDTDDQMGVHAQANGDFLKSDTVSAGVNFVNTGRSYTLSDDKGFWELDWQFMYKADSANQNGFITGYNNMYPQLDTLELKNSLFTNYVNVLQSDLTAFEERNSSNKTMSITLYYGDNPGKTVNVDRLGYQYSLEGDPNTWDPNADYYKFFTTYFRSEFEQYVAEYNAYLDPEDTSVTMKPATVTRCLYDYEAYDSVDEQYRYLTQKLLEDSKNYNMTLEAVTMYYYSGDEKLTKNVLVFRMNGGNDTYITPNMSDRYFVDDNKFIARDYISLLGIAENAFKNVNNVFNLTMTSNIQYICDRAFYDSFLRSVSLYAGAQVGNQAFAECDDLTSVALDGVTAIGKEAFAGTHVSKVVIPRSVIEVGDGAFYNCGYLSDLSFEEGSNSSKKIGKAAFCDCVNLKNLTFNDARITAIEDAAFALTNPSLFDKDQLKAFDMPDYISSGANLGEYILANRRNLTNVDMSSGLNDTTIPDTLVAGCTGLAKVYFPDTAGGVTYDPTMFYGVANPDFYVQGPKLYGNNPANTRKSTWSALMQAVAGLDENGNLKYTGVSVPYVYVDGDENYYEICQDNCVMCINDEGLLNSCDFAPGAVKSDLDFVIPASVAGKTVTGIKDGCFTPDILAYLKSLEIADGSQIREIGDEVFRGSVLESVNIGNSVESIGAGTFADCNSLKKVTIGENIASIGNSAFENCSDLTDIYFDKPESLDTFKAGSIGDKALSTNSGKLTIHGEIGVSYAPFAWAMNPANYVDNTNYVRALYQKPSMTGDDKSLFTVILDNQNNLATLVDYLHYDQLDADIRNRYEGGGVLNVDEENEVDAAYNVVIPDGIQSIDAKGYFNNSSLNPDNVTQYSNNSNIAAYDMLTGIKYYGTYKQYGLFNGLYGESTGSDIMDAGNGQKETEAVGNDRITSVSMSDVCYLPDECFNSCENLQTVYLGDKIVDVGKLPFLHCTSLTSVGCGNDNFVADNGILYQNIADGSKILKECFASRGSAVGSSSISLSNDPDLAGISSIDPEAFSDCYNITNVDLTGVNGFEVIPANCFDGCKLLTEVDIPENVGVIESEAFANTGTYTKVIVRGHEVSLGSNAFQNVEQPYLVSYSDSAVRKAARNQGVNVEQTLDNTFTVKFYTYDGLTLIKSVFVTEGGNAEAPDESEIPEREGYKFVGWNRSIKNVREDMFVLAMYEPIGSTSDTDITPGVTPTVTPSATDSVKPATPGVSPNVTPGSNNNNNNTTKYQLTVVYGSGTGQYPAGTTVIIEAIDAPAGKVFDKWVVTGTSATIYSSTSKATTIKTAAGETVVTATYKDASKSSGSSGTTPSSSGTTSRNGSTTPNSGRTISNNGTSVNITKSGISNTDKAYASVSGSTDSFIVKVTESSDAADKVATALAKKFEDMTPIKYFAMDISLYDSTGVNKIEDTSNLSVNVTIPIPDALVPYAGNNKVGAVSGDNQLETLGCRFSSIDGIPCISFTAKHFSPYTIYVDTNNLTQGTIDYSPKTGDPIHPKWFVAIALAATSLFLFFKKDRKMVVPKVS
ncbi:MAG: leucine-rich repeat protein [Lachnospiraceae bacterium]|nr:leucine-rich repeat protein [Lachnospiraceae bacterium]